MLFNSSLDNIIKCNDSFDYGVLRIAYHGENRNGSFISRETMERCAKKSIHNVPVVANYHRETDSIGAHDAEIVRKKGTPTLVNVTQPIGVVPESADFWWNKVAEDDGTVHEYLCADVLLWKRQEAYAKIKEDGITAQSMEIGVNQCHRENKLLIVEDFEFQAFCLLGNAEPCFESASLATFDKDEFYTQFAAMLSDLPDAITHYTKKGVSNMDIKEKLQLMEKYNITLEDIDFELDEFSIEELTEKFDAMKFDGEGGDDPGETETGGETGNETGGTETGGTETGGEQTDGETGGTDTTEPEDGDDSGEDGDDGDDEDGSDDSDDDVPVDDGDDDVATGAHGVAVKTRKIYLLDSEFRRELYDAVSVEMVHDEDGFSYPRYFIIDHDASLSTVYCVDTANHWITMGIPYSMNGDHVVIDFANAKRVKVVFEEFDEGTISDDSLGFEAAASEFARIKIEHATNKVSAELEEANGRLAAIVRNEAEKELFAKFTDLSDVEAFQDLYENRAQFDLETLEDKCYAIRGRLGKFSLAPQKGVQKLPVDSNVEVEPEPYGGLVRNYI